MSHDESLPVVDPALLPNNERTRLLLKEAFSLVAEISDMDKRIDARIREVHGDFAVAMDEFFQGKSTAATAVDKGAKAVAKAAINKSFGTISKVLGFAVKEISGLGIVISVASPQGRPGIRDAYMDGMPNEKRRKYEEKKNRLHAIMHELLNSQSVPTKVNLDSICTHERCWQAHKPRLP